jgi:chromosome segregation ATPase
MSQYDDEDGGFDGPEETDPVIRELRTEVVRLRAQLDQLAANLREREREAAGIRATLAELEEAVERLKARRQRDDRILVVLAILTLGSLALSLTTYFTM